MGVVIIISILMICITVIIVKGLDVMAENPELLTKLEKNEKNKLQSGMPVDCNINNDRHSSNLSGGGDFNIGYPKNK